MAVGTNANDSIGDIFMYKKPPLVDNVAENGDYFKHRINWFEQTLQVNGIIYLVKAKLLQAMGALQRVRRCPLSQVVHFPHITRNLISSPYPSIPSTLRTTRIVRPV